jgi:cell division protein FtsN
MESEVVQEPTVSKCGRKHGNQNSKEEQKALPVSKKTKESVDHALNSTFSIDKQMFQQQQNQLLEKQQQQQQQLQEQQQLQIQLRKQEILLQLKQLREGVQQLQQEKQQIQQRMEELQQQLQEERQQLKQLRQQLQLSIALRKMKYKKCHKLEKFGRNA